MSEPDRQPDPIASLLERAVELNEPERLVAKNRFLDRVEHELKHPQRGHKLAWYGAPLALAAGVLLALFLWKAPGALQYQVQGAVRDGDYVRAQKDRPAEITFSDRTHIHVSPEARLRVDDLDRPEGARVALERGKIDVHVTHRDSTSWRFDAGPFKVHVTGTRFALNWEADAERLELVLHEGSVEVEGYFGSGIVSVHAGQRFVGDAKRRTMLVSDISGPVEASKTRVESEQASPDLRQAAKPPAASASGPTLALAPSSAPSSRNTRASNRGSWPELVSKGAFKQVVDDATERGLGNCLISCAGDELNALADAARYVGRRDLAMKALMALRARNAAAYGVRAAFLLGRLEENQGAMARAKSWYETVLREGPGGAFASDALAGKMRTVSALQGKGAARAVAHEYLGRYPNGAHAAAARQLAEGP